jgi:eukaryotic-like serine/threonine-protein kinase
VQDYRGVTTTLGLQPGMQVTPSLRLVRPLAVGGMGSVWVARHVGLQTDVVVKFILANLVNEPEVLARFQREAAAAADVKSPHVVQMIDHGVTDAGLPFIAMELLDGEDLEARIEREGAIPPGEVAGVVLQVSRALSRAHEKKIIHRDIKPENIFLCDTGEEEAFVKVLDFGIAKVTDLEQQHTLTGEIVGSPLWMSPEQVMALKSIDHRSDLWSLGIVAFYALTGKLPFGGSTIATLSVAICTADPPPPSQFNPELSPAIDQWFAAACARDVTKRFQTARAMADALVNAVGGPQNARVRLRGAMSMGSMPTRVLLRASLPPAAVPKQVVSRRPVFIAAGAAVAVIALIGIIVLVWPRPSPAPITEPAESTEAPSSSPPPSASTLPDAAPADAHSVAKPRVAKPKKPVVPKSTKH